MGTFTITPIDLITSTTATSTATTTSSSTSSSSTPSSTDSSGGGSGPSPGLIAGVVIAILVVMVFATFFGIWHVQRRRRQREERRTNGLFPQNNQHESYDASSSPFLMSGAPPGQRNNSYADSVHPRPLFSNARAGPTNYDELKGDLGPISTLPSATTARNHPHDDEQLSPSSYADSPTSHRQSGRPSLPFGNLGHRLATRFSHADRSASVSVPLMDQTIPEPTPTPVVDHTLAEREHEAERERLAQRDRDRVQERDFGAKMVADFGASKRPPKSHPRNPSQSSSLFDDPINPRKDSEHRDMLHRERQERELELRMAEQREAAERERQQLAEAEEERLRQEAEREAARRQEAEQEAERQRELERREARKREIELRDLQRKETRARERRAREQRAAAPPANQPTPPPKDGAHFADWAKAATKREPVPSERPPRTRDTMGFPVTPTADMVAADLYAPPIPPPPMPEVVVPIPMMDDMFNYGPAASFEPHSTLEVHTMPAPPPIGASELPASISPILSELPAFPFPNKQVTKMMSKESLNESPVMGAGNPFRISSGTSKKGRRPTNMGQGNGTGLSQ